MKKKILGSIFSLAVLFVNFTQISSAIEERDEAAAARLAAAGRELVQPHIVIREEDGTIVVEHRDENGRIIALTSSIILDMNEPFFFSF